MIIDYLMGLASKDLGIDLGSANTVVVARDEGIVLVEPSVVAVKSGTRTILMNGEAIGAKALQMIGRTPGSIDAIRPIKAGVISEFELSESLLACFIRRAHKRNHFLHPRVVIAIPATITAVEKRAVISSAERAGARQVRLVKKPLAAAIGSGLPVAEPRGSMIVDIGAGTVEIAVVSLSDLVESVSLRTAGDAITEAIVKHMKSAHNLLIGEQTAERVKLEIGSAYKLDEELMKEVGGRDYITGLPKMVEIGSEELREAIQQPLDTIIKGIRLILEKTPPELGADLIESGITLAGGGSLLRGMDKLLARDVGLSIRRADDPMTAVARGVSIMVDQLDSVWDSLDDGRDSAMN